MDKPFDYVVGDIHAMHERIREYCPTFRGHYQSREEMTEDILQRLNDQIAPGKKLLFLGDLSLNYDEGLKFIKGTHFDWDWAPGNHDKCSVTNRKGWQQSRAKALRECPNLKSIQDEYFYRIGSVLTLFNHFPWADLSDERHDTKYMELRPRREGYPGAKWCIHGHIHSLPTERLRDRALDVGWDAWGRAVSYEEIEEIINAGAIPT